MSTISDRVAVYVITTGCILIYGLSVYLTRSWIAAILLFIMMTYTWFFMLLVNSGMGSVYKSGKGLSSFLTLFGFMYIPYIIILAIILALQSVFFNKSGTQ